MKDALYFLFETVLELLVLAFLLRLILQMVRADFYNPVSQAIIRLTNPLVVPARRLLPSLRGFDLPLGVLILVLQVAVTFALWGLQYALVGTPFPGLTAIFNIALLQLVRLVIQFYFFAMLVYALLSWFGPHGRHPVAGLLSSICEPVLAPVRRVLPPMGGLDFSVLVVILGLQALLIALR